MLKKMILLTIAITTILAPVALAGHNDHRYGPPDRIVAVADDLVDAARQMSRDAARGVHGRHGSSSDLLYTLDRLERQARQFRRDAVRDASLRSLDNQLAALFVTFDRADRKMRFVRSARLQRDFEQVGRLMQRLALNVEAAMGPRHRDRRGGLHGAVVLGDGHLQVRVRF